MSVMVQVWPSWLGLCVSSLACPKFQKKVMYSVSTHMGASVNKVSVSKQ